MTAEVAFQEIFNRAESISINKRAVTAQTTSRDSTVRSVSRGGQVWRFEVKLPDGIRWSELRPYIELIDYADRVTSGNVSLNISGTSEWLTPYQGDANLTVGFSATVTQGYSNITLTSSPTVSSGYKFKIGDLIQLDTNGHVYSVVENVTNTGNIVNLNRPVIDSSGSKGLLVGPNVYWNLICTEMPTWTIFARDQVSWSGPFIFSEVMA